MHFDEGKPLNVALEHGWHLPLVRRVQTVARLAVSLGSERFICREKQQNSCRDEKHAWEIKPTMFSFDMIGLQSEPGREVVL